MAESTNAGPDESENIKLWLESDKVPRTGVRAVSITGKEAISRPYQFEILFASQTGIDPKDVIGQTARIGIDAIGHELVANGVILQFEQNDPSIAGDFVYRVILVPRLSLLEFTRQNQIYGTETSLSLVEIIDQTMASELRKQSSFHAGREVNVVIEKRIFGRYRSRNHIVQFQETDLAFISRLCEHNGVFYFFEQRDTGEVAIFGDRNIAFNLVDLPDGKLQYLRPGTSMRPTNCVTSLRSEHRVLTNRVVLTEYNEQSPSLELRAQADVSAEGFGFVVEYGQNFLTPDEGQRLAQVRAEELEATGNIYFGESTSPQLRPGLIFELDGHPDSAFNTKYLVTEVFHEGTNPFDAVEGIGLDERSYKNRFSAIPAETAFRPRRLTPKPVAAGIFSATVDATGSGERAELDD